MFSYFNCLGKYATFRGRTRRWDFWWYTIINNLFLTIIGYFCFTSETPLSQGLSFAIFIIYVAITITPTLAAMTRRWHDLGRSGKWLWLNLVPVVGTVVSYIFFLGRGEESTNEYGLDPSKRRRPRRRR